MSIHRQSLLNLLKHLGGGGVHSKGLTGHLIKVDPNESGSLDHFAFVRWYLDNEVSLDSTYEVEMLLGLGLQYQSYWSSVRSFIH